MPHLPIVWHVKFDMLIELKKKTIRIFVVHLKTFQRLQIFIVVISVMLYGFTYGNEGEFSSIQPPPLLFDHYSMNLDVAFTCVPIVQLFRNRSGFWNPFLVHGCLTSIIWLRNRIIRWKSEKLFRSKHSNKCF